MFYFLFINILIYFNSGIGTCSYIIRLAEWWVDCETNNHCLSSSSLSPAMYYSGEGEKVELTNRGNLLTTSENMDMWTSVWLRWHTTHSWKRLQSTQRALRRRHLLRTARSQRRMFRDSEAFGRRGRWSTRWWRRSWSQPRCLYEGSNAKETQSCQGSPKRRREFCPPRAGIASPEVQWRWWSK